MKDFSSILRWCAAALLGAGLGVPATAVGPVKFVATAVIVKSWGNCGESLPIWRELNDNWSNYGRVKVRIGSHPALCSDREITYEALAASGAQTVILSNPAGGNMRYNRRELQALARYASEGHNLIGTYALLYNPISGVDNRLLARLFGLPGNVEYGIADAVANPLVYDIVDGHQLFRDVGDPYLGRGFVASQAPVDGSWGPEDYGKARPLAVAGDNKSVVLGFCGEGFHSLYVSHMPEHHGGQADNQLIYNFIVAGLRNTCRR
jgi:hypothetical protein